MTSVSLSPTLSWLPSDNTTSYRLQVSTVSTFLSTVLDQSGISVTSYNMNGLNKNTTYYWRVYATGTGGTSEWSNTWTFSTISSPPPPGLSSPSNGSTGIAITPHTKLEFIKWSSNISITNIDKF